MVGSLYGARAVLLALTAGNLLSATVVTVPQADFSRTYPLSPTAADNVPVLARIRR